jgi:hypothetical protein
MTIPLTGDAGASVRDGAADWPTQEASARQQEVPMITAQARARHQAGDRPFLRSSCTSLSTN